MPVSWMFLIFPVTLLTVGFIALTSHDTGSRRAWMIGLSGIYLLPLVFIVLSELRWFVSSRLGSKEADYHISRIIECKSEYLAFWYPYWSDPDVVSGLPHLRRAADANVLPAMHAFGVRLKDDYYIESTGLTASDGQRYIDAAIKQGFVPGTPEIVYYSKVYRRWPW